MENSENDQPRLYSPLLPGDVRLLCVNADSLTHQAGSLKVIALDMAPPYYALSHCWGPQDRNIEIQIDDHILHVSPELAAGIRRCQELAVEDSDLEPPAKYLWIDCICINQYDIPERSLQVELMGQIYSQSIRTLIWLGPETGSCSAAWTLVDHIYNTFKAQQPAAKALVDIPVKFYSDSSHDTTGLPQWDNKLWVSLNQLMQLGWFSRIWVVQEVVLSPQDPVIVHGRHLYPWHHLGWAAAWMRRNGYIRLPQIPEEFRNVDTICNIRRSQAKWPLDALMSITQIKFHATDQRDKIYGLLGLAAECQDASKFPETLLPDYDISISQLYQKVARFLLKRSRSLAMLTRARGTCGSLTRRHRQYDLTGLPSWVPDWSDFRVSNRNIRTSLSWVDYKDTSKPARLGFPTQYNASAALELNFHDTADTSVLRMSAIRIDNVVQAVSFNTENSSVLEFKEEFALSMTRICDKATSLFAGGDILSWAKRIVQTTTAEQCRLGGRTWDQTLKDGLAYLYTLLLDNKAQLSLIISKSGDTKAMNSLQLLSDGGDPEEYAALARNFCFDRSFIITATGCMGIGPSNTFIGDTVTIILGGGVPYIIRPKGASWVFVGESYIQGLMNGEAIQSCQQGFLQEEILDIR
ncbi:heterokaryon incompatibility protein-1 [Coleophoma cylindrospora]|uniref:Heterokaryon incompatibility protein-1 n=1 Tax=Coleophoma cylindrospora TaxID=1849047 RepID=A0A3D8Q9W7_9HELO|nr:heterokaryon incompatibility protein-1 [Coleophoma cylindrospora]